MYNLLQRRLTKTYTALQTSAFSIFFGTMILAIFLPTSLKEAMHAPAIQFFYIAVLGVCSSAILCLMLKGIRKSKKNVTSEQLYVYHSFFDKYFWLFHCE
jgi:drug/metabolite transporter (DMT)-like permease